MATRHGFCGPNMAAALRNVGGLAGKWSGSKRGAESVIQVKSSKGQLAIQVAWLACTPHPGTVAPSRRVWRHGFGATGISETHATITQTLQLASIPFPGIGLTDHPVFCFHQKKAVCTRWRLWITRIHVPLLHRGKANTQRCATNKRGRKM